MKIKGAFPVRWAAQDGAPGTGVTIVQALCFTKYSSSSSGTTHPADSSSDWKTSVPTVANGNYLWTWTHVHYSDGTHTDSYSVSRMGIDGVGIISSVTKYCQKANTNTAPENFPESDWGAFPTNLVNDYWLYTRTIVTYSNQDTAISYDVAQIGQGSYYAGCQEYYCVSNDGDNAPSGYPNSKPFVDGVATYANGEACNVTGSWSTSKPTANNSTPYIWNFEISYDSRGNKYVTHPVRIGNFAKGISSIVETYTISSHNDVESMLADLTERGEYQWQDEQHAAVPTDEYPYQWNKTVVNYNNGSPDTYYHISAVKGADGKGSTYIDLDNENDSMLYDGAGNLIGGNSGWVTSNISLYSNGQKITSNLPTFYIKERSASITSANAVISGQVLTVKGLTGDSGWVVVKCTYNNVEYTAKMTVKRLVGVDKYELQLNHNAVSYNTTTGVLSNTDIAVEVYRTAQNGSRTKVTTMATYTLTAKLYPNGASTNSRSITFNSSGNGTASITAEEAAAWTNLAIVLFKNGSEVDRDTIPINKAQNGGQGPGAIILDLDNENDSMLYDGADNPVSDVVVSTGSLYKGPSKVTSGITWSIASVEGCTMMNSGAATSISYSRSTYPTAVWISSNGLVKVNGLSASQGKVVVNAHYDDNDYQATLTLKKLRGVDKYELVLKPAALTYNSTTGLVNGASFATVVAEIWRTAQNGDRTLVDDFNGANQYGLSIVVTPDAGSLSGTTPKSYGLDFSVSSSLANTASNIAVTLKKGTMTYDSETIPIAKTTNGSGSPGPAAKAIYRLSFDRPATPTGASPQGSGAIAWHDDPFVQDDVKIELQGDWFKDTDGFMRAPAVGTYQYVHETLSFVTTASNQKVYLRVKATLGSGSYIRIGNIDAKAPATDYLRSVSGSNQDTGDIDVTVPYTGTHFIVVRYYRGGNTDTYAKFACGKMDVWQSNAKTYNSAGTITAWSTPFKVGSDSESDSSETHANILKQTAFIANKMDAWLTKNGSTSEGTGGRNSYVGDADYGSPYKELLMQSVWEPGGYQPIKASKWYTLSFWAKSKPYIQITKNETSNAYGFARVKPIYFEAGVTNTIWVNGYVSSAAKNAGKSLRVLVYGDGENDVWGSTIASVKIEATSATTSSATFTVPTTGWYNIMAYVYLEPNGGNSPVDGQTARVNYYRVDRGMRMMTYLYPNCNTDEQYSYTAIDTSAGRILDGQMLSTSPTDNGAEFKLTEDWTKHTLVFKTRSYIPNKRHQFLIRMHEACNGMYICMPKLEEGTQATGYVTNDNDTVDIAIEETGFPNDRGVWVESPATPYQWNDTSRDYVDSSVSGEWKRYFVKKKGMVVPNGTGPTSGGNSYWEEGSRISTLLVNTIVGANADITFAKSNRIIVTNENGTVAAGLGGAENGNDDYPLWVGATYENRASAAFRVTLSGKLYAADADISGKITAIEGTIGGFTIGSSSITSDGSAILRIGTTNFKTQFGITTQTKTVSLNGNPNGVTIVSYSFTCKENNRFTLRNDVGSSYNWRNFGAANIIDLDFFNNTNSSGTSPNRYGFQYAMIGKGHVIVDGIVQGACYDEVTFSEANQVHMIQFPLYGNRINVKSSYDNDILILPDKYSVFSALGCGLIRKFISQPFTFRIDIINTGTKNIYVAGYNDLKVGSSSNYTQPFLDENLPYLRYRNTSYLDEKDVYVSPQNILSIMLMYDSSGVYRAIIVNQPN